MAEEFRLDPDALEHAVDRIEDRHDDGLAGLRGFSAQLDRLRGCWGSDDAGKAFAKNYVHTAQQTVDGAQALLDGTAGVTTNIVESAKNFRDLDEASAAALDRQISDELR